jgi:transposase-like protein
MAQIARDRGITEQTLCNWLRSWQQQGDLVLAPGKPAEQWSAAAMFPVVLQTGGLNGTQLAAYCRERGLYPQQVARWRQAAQDANNPSAPTMQDHREL